MRKGNVAGKDEISPQGGYRTPGEAEVPGRIASTFEQNRDSTASKLENFPKYIRRQKVTRYLALYELFKLSLPVKGSIIECGVNQGFGLMSWANFSAVLEPNNLTRRIYGFDTFTGFPHGVTKHRSKRYTPKKGDLAADSYDELTKLIEIYDDNRFLGHVDKVHLIKGDVRKTVPEFIEENGHLIVSLLFLDLDLYEPTKVCLQNFLPRMPRGAVLAFDELDNPIWPGETMALMEAVGVSNLELKRFEFDPYISYALVC
ncbi:MAG: class I SAM-dependent methyltransferase [Deltaproteobacteria bacterium]|nr:class I SAM-dependent methyltransferase [Deltaproteobacteria bacterium]